AHDGGSVFVDAAQVALPDEPAIHFGIGPAHRFGIDAGHAVDLAAEETRSTGLNVVDRAGNTLDAPCPVSIQANPDIKIGQEIESGDPVEHMPAFDSIHAAERNITFRYSLQRLRGQERFL